MAHGYCQFGRNFANLSEIKISSNLSMSSMSFTMDTASQPNHPSLNPYQAGVSRSHLELDPYPAPFLQTMENNPTGPLAPCYLIPSLKCSHCNSKDPKNRVLGFVNEAQIAYHGASKWSFWNINKYIFYIYDTAGQIIRKSASKENNSWNQINNKKI